MKSRNRPESPTARRLDARALRYSASVKYDSSLYAFDIAASIAHARMLGKQGIIASDDAKAIIKGLQEIEREIEREEFQWRDELEDLHLNIEAALREKIGPAAGRLHTARSRNDQVATDMRLFVRTVSFAAVDGLRGLQAAVLDLAETHLGTLMPGYTHLQRAQPVLLAHHLLAYFEMFERDIQRFATTAERADVLPLGSGALAGVPYPIDREVVAEELGFSSLSANSIDAVSDRDFVIDFHASAAILMTHISRLAEEIILWSSEEFGFLRLPPKFATGSSIMPQKSNPDIAELARARSGRAIGNLVSVLAVMKGLPLSYNRDLQEDKQPLFDTVSNVMSTLEVLTAMVPSLQFDKDRMEAAASAGYLLATDLADHLVGKGLPFRDAHQSVMALVEYAQSRDQPLASMTLDEYRRFSPLFDEAVLRLDARSSVASRDVAGGTAPGRVRDALKQARRILEEEWPARSS